MLYRSCLIEAPDDDTHLLFCAVYFEKNTVLYYCQTIHVRLKGVPQTSVALVSLGSQKTH